MDRGQFEKHWNEIKDKVREKWSKLSYEDINRINGRYDQFLNELQRKYGWTKEQAEKELSGWRMAGMEESRSGQGGRREEQGSREGERRKEKKEGHWGREEEKEEGRGEWERTGRYEGGQEEEKKRKEAGWGKEGEKGREKRREDEERKRKAG